VIRSALISDDGRYRYVLGRRWAPDGPVATFVMLNPSTADATVDDPTIRRCVGFSQHWGMAAVHVLNLYAYRATKPADLWKADDPVGPENYRRLMNHVLQARIRRDPFVVAWGTNAKPDRVAEFVDSLGVWADHLTCLGTTKAGAPRHPLYVLGGTALRPWRLP
jgi:hypothetical protein